MKILVLGNGAREHALAWTLSPGRCVTDVLCAPGNAGTAARRAEPRPSTYEHRRRAGSLAPRTDRPRPSSGPSSPRQSASSIGSQAAGLPIVGPDGGRGAARDEQGLGEGVHGAPSRADRAIWRRDDGSRRARGGRAGEFGWPLVVKADGLAAGKGVVVAPRSRGSRSGDPRHDESTSRFGAAGARVVLEECLTGPKCRSSCSTDGERAMPLGTAQDHKRVFDDDRGPEHRRHGRFSPSPLVDDALARARDRLRSCEPVLTACAPRDIRIAGSSTAG